MQERRRRPTRGCARARLAVVASLASVAAAAMAVAASACSLRGLDSGYVEDALGAPDAGLAGDAALRSDADLAPDGEVTDDAGDAAIDGADGDSGRPDGDAAGGPLGCPHVDGGLMVCDDSPAHAMAVVHCADAGPLSSSDFYACGSSADCMSGSLCVDEGFCKPICTASIQCADDSVAVSYGATSCNPVLK